MGTSQAEKARTKARILDAAVERFRQDGLSDVSIVDVMRVAGLTHGGFYKHFEDREELVVEGLRRALIPVGQAGPYRSYPGFVRKYLSRTHRETRGRGCPIAALAGDVARADARSRSVFTAGVANAFVQVARLLGSYGAEGSDTQGADTRARAAAAFSTAVGALVLSRAVDDSELSDFILASARKALLEV